MADLLRKPAGASGKIHAITAADAGWGYVGFDVWRLGPGEAAEDATGAGEAILVLIEGKAAISAGGADFGALGERLSVFEQTPPAAVYLPPGAEWRAVAETACEIGVCRAPSPGGRSAQVIGPAGIAPVMRGKGTNIRRILPIAMEERDVADSLLVTEVFTPAGHWSSYPPHRHDEDDFPRMTYLEETYYHRLNPGSGFGIQRVFTERGAGEGALDETMAVADRDVVLVPKGHHPCAAPYGVEMYYLNVMAGPRRAWRFENHPDFDWIAQRDAS